MAEEGSAIVMPFIDLNEQKGFKGQLSKGFTDLLAYD